MKEYTVQFDHDHGYSEATVEAETMAEALEKAKTYTEDDLTYIEHFDVGNVVYSIIVRDDDDEILEYNAPAFQRELHSWELGDLLLEAYRLMPLGTKIRADWMDRAGAVLKKAGVL